MLDSKTTSAAALTKAANTDHADCPVCGSTLHHRFVDLGNREFHRCSACKTVFQFPRPSASDAKDRHTDRYHGATTSYFAKVDKKMRRARFDLALLSLIAPRGRFLDIGCNGGFTTEAARERGYEAHGLDIDRVSVAYAREHYPKATFYDGTVADLPESAGRFDLIYCSEVIEHVPEAKEFLAGIARLLKPGGLLYITTPNINHWSVPSDVRKFKSLRSDGHCLFYSADGLRGAFKKLGVDFRFSIPNAKPGMRMVFRKQA